MVTAAGDGIGIGLGIGPSSALAFSAAGARVLVSDLNDDAGQEPVKLIREPSRMAEYLHANASNETDVAALVSIVVQHEDALDFALNNPGVSAVTKPITEQITEQDGADWERTLGVTLIGAM